MYEHPYTNSMSAERSIRFQFPAREYGYRNSFPPLKNSSGNKNRTASIPINRQSMRKTDSEHRMAQDEAEADYKDFVFYSRVVDGISKQNSLLKDGSYLKSANETLLDHIVRARHEREEEELEEDNGYHNHCYYPSRLYSHNDMKIVTPAKENSTMDVLPISGDGGYHFDHDYEDEGVFDFEL